MTLSGLPGVGSFSGASQQGPSGTTPAQGQATPGLTGGLDLAQLLALLGQQGGAGDAGIGTGLGLGAGIGAGSFGQSGADLGLQGAGGPPQSMVAGGTQGAPGAGAGSIDPLALTQKLLGLASKGAGLLGTASPTQDTLGDTGGVSLSDQVRSLQGGAIPALTGGPSPTPTASPTGVAADFLGVPPGSAADVAGQAAGGVGAAPGSAIGGGQPGNTTLSFLAQGPPGGVPTGAGTPQQELIQSMLTAGFTPDQIQQVMGNLGGVQGFGAGEIPGGGASIPTASPSSGLSGANLGGAAAGGLGAAGGLLGLIQGAQNNNPVQAGGGAVGAAGGGIQAANALGYGSEALGTVAQALPLVSAILGGIGAGEGTATGNERAYEGAAQQAILSYLAGGSAIAAPVFGVAMAIANALSRPGNEAINRFTGVQGPLTTQALERAQLPAGTDLSQLGTQQLEGLVGAEGNALSRFYNQNLPESRYLTGLQAEQSPELGQVQNALGSDKNTLLQSIGLLQQRGVGNDVLGNILSPQLNNISQIYNSDFVGVPGYTSPAALMQQQGFGSNQELAAAYGGPTWLALQNIFGPGLAQGLGAYGGTAPGLNLPAPAGAGSLAAANAASQYNPNLPATPEQIAAQYGALPAWLGSPE